MNEKQIAEINHINSLLPSDFEDDCIGMSNICLILSAYYDGELHLLTLDDLISIFQKPKEIERIVKSKIKLGFVSSYVYPTLELLNNGYAETYIRQLTALKNIEFEKLYRTRILPLVQEEIKQKQADVAQYDSKALFGRIAKLKNTPIIEHTNIYVSFFSMPTAFTLYGGSFLTCFTPPKSVDFYSIIAHELMHGFASADLIELYQQRVNSSEVLSKCHTALIHEYCSGDEEEFVMAAEYYLCYLSGCYKREELLKRANARYDGNCPTSIEVFNLLCSENELPTDYNRWLLDCFAENKL